MSRKKKPSASIPAGASPRRPFLGIRMSKIKIRFFQFNPYSAIPSEITPDIRPIFTPACLKQVFLL
jgi:hypothetical protein